MSSPDIPRPPRKPDPLDIVAVRIARMQQRRDKIVAEIQANRRGEYKVPTWVLALVLALMIAAVIAFITLFG
jgi:hypothetical protein